MIRDEETIEIAVRCTDPECDWRGEVEIHEGTFAYPCPGCDAETLERLR